MDQSDRDRLSRGTTRFGGHEETSRTSPLPGEPDSLDPNDLGHRHIRLRRHHCESELPASRRAANSVSSPVLEPFRRQSIANRPPIAADNGRNRG